MAKTDSDAPRAVGQVTHGLEKSSLKSGSTGKVLENPKQVKGTGMDAHRPADDSDAGPAPAKRGSPAAPDLPQDTDTSVAGEEDPGAALDQTGKAATRQR